MGDLCVNNLQKAILYRITLQIVHCKLNMSHGAAHFGSQSVKKKSPANHYTQNTRLFTLQITHYTKKHLKVHIGQLALTYLTRCFFFFYKYSFSNFGSKLKLGKVGDFTWMDFALRWMLFILSIKPKIRCISISDEVNRGRFCYTCVSSRHSRKCVTLLRLMTEIIFFSKLLEHPFSDHIFLKNFKLTSYLNRQSFSTNSNAENQA